MGGNSTKATSGINGAGTQTQQEQGIPDNAKIFFDDTKKSVRSSFHTRLSFLLILSLGSRPRS
jgi:succinate dehydrogenase/fumarate reductase flavoprotein subunit